MATKKGGEGNKFVEALLMAAIPISVDLAGKGIETLAKFYWNKRTDDKGKSERSSRRDDESRPTDESHGSSVPPNRVAFEKLCSSALDCNKCFQSGTLKRGFVNLPQPRYVGAGYWSAPVRRLFLMINPGSGNGSEDDRTLLRDLEAYKSKKIDLAVLFARQHDSMPNWGTGRFVKFFQNIGVGLEEIAMLNVAWCATESNRYPREMLNTCFEARGRATLEFLRPTMIIACGDVAQGFARRSGLPYVPVPHFAARSTLDYEQIARRIGMSKPSGG